MARTSLAEYENEWKSSCILYIVLFSVFLTISIGISTVFDMINIKDVNPDVLKIEKRSYKNTVIYYIGFIAIKNISDYGSINSANPLYLMIHGEIGHIEEKNRGKCLALSPYNGLVEKYKEVWGKINSEIEVINANRKFEYGKDFMKIKFDSDDNVPLKKQIKLSTWQ